MTDTVKLVRHSGSWIHYPAPFGAGDEIMVPEGDFYERLAKREHGPGPAAVEWARRPKSLLTFRRITTPGFFGGDAFFEVTDHR